jgi:hypothetical protein
MGILTSGYIRDRIGEKHETKRGVIENKQLSYSLRIPRTREICDIIKVDYNDNQFFKFFKYENYLMTRVKNIEKTLKKDIQNISAALKFFKEVHWFLVQSDSTDKSEEILSEIKKININFKYLSIDTPENSYSFRTERLAIGRNKYLSYIRENIDPLKFPYIVIADFNLLNNKLSSEAVLSSWSRDDWDVVTANQSGRYYDIWALRHPLWSPNDCWEQHEFLKKYIKIPEIVNAYSIKSRMLRIPKGSDWIPVESAFGGFAIYKSNFLMHNFFYEGKNEAGNMICEHVYFNKKIKQALWFAQGKKRQIVEKSPAQGVGFGFFALPHQHLSHLFVA